MHMPRVRHAHAHAYAACEMRPPGVYHVLPEQVGWPPSAAPCDP